MSDTTPVAGGDGKPAKTKREGQAANALRVLSSLGNTNGNSWLKQAVAANIAAHPELVTNPRPDKGGKGDGTEGTDTGDTAATETATKGSDAVASELGLPTKKKPAKKPRPLGGDDEEAKVRAANAIKVLASLPSQAKGGTAGTSWLKTAVADYLKPPVVVAPPIAAPAPVGTTEENKLA